MEIRGENSGMLAWKSECLCKRFSNFPLHKRALLVMGTSACYVSVVLSLPCFSISFKVNRTANRKIMQVDQHLSISINVSNNLVILLKYDLLVPVMVTVGIGAGLGEGF